MACGLVLAQLRAQMALPGHAGHPGLGLLYITDHYARAAQDILDHLAAELPEVTDWAGTVGVGIAVTNAEYWDEPALAVMLCDLPPDQYRVFSGVAPLGVGEGMGFAPHTALVHADGQTPDVTELIAEMAQRTATGYLFGGLSSARDAMGGSVQFAVGGNGTIKGQGRASGVFRGGLSGVAFGDGVAMVSRVTQGCQPIAPRREVTAADGHVLLALGGEPALEVLLRDLGITLERPQEAIGRLRGTLVGLSQAAPRGPRTAGFGDDVLVRHLIGLDPLRQGVAVAEHLRPGMQVAFCRRDPQAARADLVRICTEIREELEPQEAHQPPSGDADGALALAAPPMGAPPGTPVAPMARGAVYISCAGRGGPHFGGPSAELQLVRRTLGDVPLVGFFAGGEIARHHLYGYTGVLTVFR